MEEQKLSALALDHIRTIIAEEIAKATAAPDQDLVHKAVDAVDQIAEADEAAVSADHQSVEESFHRLTGRAFSGAPAADLLRAYAGILAELRAQDIVRTADSPTGGYAEYLVALALEGTRAPNAAKGWDVATKRYGRVQVKSRVVSGHGRAERQLSHIRNFEFDYLVIVFFNPDYTVNHAAALRKSTVENTKGTLHTYVGAYTIFATDDFLQQPGVENITDAVRNAAEGKDRQRSE